jgi:hypothetical protein
MRVKEDCMSSPGPHPFVRAIFAFAALALLAACSGGGAMTPATQGGSVSQTGHGGSGIPMIAGCQIFPADNPWNTDISSAPVDPNSDNYLSHMNAGTENIEAGFGPDPKQGIPITMAGPSTPWVPMDFVDYPKESDPGPYPFPSNARIEGGKQGTGDRHVLVIDQDGCNLFETWESHYSGPGWQAANGARFDLSSNKLRPECWTSADAAGLPIAVPLVKYDEVADGAINHAMRFTMAVTQAAYVHPATHYASNSQDPNDPPMGLRLRLKASYDLSGITGESLVILTALKKYGMMLADNGSDWDITGATDKRWNETDLQQVRTVPASAFEVIQTGTIYTHC